MNKFLNFFEIKLYYLQQIIYSVFSTGLTHITLLTLILSFIGGILTSFNPCLIYILPLSTSQINTNKYDKIHKNIVIVGLASSIILMISILLCFSTYYTKLSFHIPLLSSILTIIIGLNSLQILELDTPSNTLDIYSTANKGRKFIFNWLIGFTIGISSSSCSTPILATTINWLSHSKNSLLIVFYTLLYLIGYIIPPYIFIYTTVNYSKITILSKLWNYMIPASGSLILGFGFFSLLTCIFT
uniref:thiol:disulfide interchange protein n=1 Tax=Caulacanthus ustulatus TaxID=31411 RepID=UPI0027DA7598|nr:thiol:disulfide interchange protein [Caulacanthus ustulatus]WCH57231.1 thiol:disulfide interchange protein [Caulacanthus ustulatus]